MTDFVVIYQSGKKNYKGGRGFQQREIISKLGFPEAPYSKEGAKTLVRQAQAINPMLRLTIAPYKEKF
jgi:hypothetical protein